MIFDFFTSFVLGLLTPLTAVCVLPLYPAFVSFLASKFKGGKEEEVNKKTYALFGSVIVLGVLAFMTILGLLFTTFLQESLTSVISVVSPIAFGILGLISLFLIFDFDFSKYLPRFNLNTQNKNPLWAAFLFGFFFGAIVIPCNPAFIATFFARALLFDSFLSSIGNFVSFGIGLGAPLLVFSLVSAKWSQNVISFLTKHKRKINLIAGLIMLGIAIYYLFFVFKIFG
jgi:cytochrome c-type biogenesis protein